VFKNVRLANNKSISKIISLQFFRRLANNLRNRLFTIQASHVLSINDNQFKEKCTQILKDLDFLDMKNWPGDCDILYGDEIIRRLAKQFQVDEVSFVRGFCVITDTRNSSKILNLKPLLDAINIVAISS
jgi:isopentenyl phosphate kinase